MRRGVWAGFLVLALLLVPEAASASDDEVAAKAGLAEMIAPPWPRYEASTRMTRGGFVDFGARLSRRAANGGATCRTATPYNYAVPCTWESLDLGTRESFLPPIGRGRITQVRIKVGNNTGDMRVVVLRAFRRPNPNGAYICCKAIASTPTLRPRRNQVTVFNVNLPVFQSAAPNGNGLYTDDHLALTMMGANAVIPANIDNSGTSLSGWYPRWQVGQERTGPYGTSGAMVLLRARWRPS